MKTWCNEFLGSGLIPMELLNVLKIREKSGLDIPVIKHELFQTAMAKYPAFPTGYDQNVDVKYQLVKRTVESQKRLTYGSVISSLKTEYGEKVALFR